MYLQFGFVIFWWKDFGTKAAHKMLVKLTPGFLFCCKFTYLERLPGTNTVAYYLTSVKSFVTLIPGVNFTNMLWVPKSFCQKITNPNCKYLKAVQRTLVWLSISPIIYKQLFHTKVLCEPFMCLQFGFVIFWQKDFGAKAAHKMLMKLTPGGSMGPTYVLHLLFSEKSQKCK